MRNLVILFSFLACALIGLTLFVGVTKVNPKPLLQATQPHLYGNKNISIEKINITVFYFVPKDATTTERSDWKEVTEQHLKRLIAFHTLMFENTSKINYTFFPEIIIGNKATKEYETVFKTEDNDALIPVKEEITQKVLSPGGNLYASLAKTKDTTSRNVYLVVFEGKGAAGNDTFALVSRSYLTDKAYEETSSTFLAHEFYHTLGLLDNYKTSRIIYKENQETTISLLNKKDIMGQVNIALPYTYIDTETLKSMGL